MRSTLTYRLLLCLGALSVSFSAHAAPEFAGATRLFEIEQEGRFKRSAPAVERLKTATQFYDFYSASSHTGFEVARRSLIFLYRDVRNDDLGLFLTHGIDDLGQPQAQRQPTATVNANITGVPNGARIAEQDDGVHEFNWGANLNQTRGNLTGNGPPIALGRWYFGDNTDGGAIDLLPTDENWEISVTISYDAGINEWAYFFADGTRLELDPNLPLKIRSLGGDQEADQVASTEGQSVTFCALATDNNADNLTYTFQWRDGSNDSQVTRPQGDLACIDHAFPDNGTYQVQVVASNPQGQSTSKIIEAIISNAPPSAVPGGPFVIETQVPSTLELNEIQDPGSADTHQVRWDYDGDGNWDTGFRDGLTYQAVYDRPGRYFARAEVRDDEGATGQTTMTVYAGVPPDIYSDETDPNVLIAGYSANDPDVPYPVYRGAPITLKAMLRNTVGCNSYQVIWDTDEDGQFEENGQDVVLNNLSPTNGSIYNVGVAYRVPTDAVEGRHLIAIRATNNCNGFIDYDVMRLYVYPWQPSSNPTQWSKEQLDVMVQIGVQEALWYMHRKMGNRSGAGSLIQGSLNASGNRVQQSTAMAIWAFTINGRLPAYPPDSINAHGHQLPLGWNEENLIRWRLDPYAETVARMVNYVTSLSAGRAGVTGDDENNTCDLNGTQCPRLPSSYAGQGAYVNGGSNYTYSHGVNTGALATVLPSLAGTPLQSGNLAGQLWEGFVQDQVDYLGYLQIPGGCGKGGWYYNRTTSGSCIYMDASTAQWGYIGLESAEVAGFRYGVFVNNNHKYKAGWNIVRNQDGYGSSAYRTDYGWSSNNLTLTGGFFVIARWLGFQDFSTNDGARPFPHSDYTKGQMRTALDRARNYTANKWNGSEYGSYHVNRRFWSGGNYLCGNSNSTYKWGSGATCGNLYAMYSHQKGYRTTSKVYDRVRGEIQEGELEPAIGGHDWAREFSIYTLRSQERNIGDYGNFGRIDDCSGGGTIACDYGRYNLGVTMGTLILTPTVFKPRPVADGEISPPEVLQGCASPDAGWVTLSHQGSFHPNPKSRIDRYEWDMDASDGYWWDGDGALDNVSTPRVYFNDAGEPLDGAKRKLRYRYNTPGTFTITLRVVDTDGEFNTKAFTVRVLPMQPSPPNATVRSGGGRYIADAELTEQPNHELALQGVVSDLNINCQDSLTVRWSIDGQGIAVPNGLQNKINSLRDANAKLTRQDLQGVELGHAYKLTLSVTDSTGLSASDETELVIYPTNPVARWQGNPLLARCGQVVTFDAQASYHPFSAQLTQANANDPSREITEYKWDLDGVPGFERIGAGAVVEQTYGRFGEYTARLQVCDGIPYCDDAQEITVTVNQGNQAPVARLPNASLIHLTEDPLTINAGASFEPDVHCGDRIVSYKWYFNPVDPTSPPQIIEQDPTLELDWNDLSQLLLGPADPRTGQPTNQVILEVEDTLGLKHRASMTLTLYPREPIAYFDQLPSPAPINEETGEVTVELDARESFSPRPGGEIINYAWDLNEDGVYGEFIGKSVITLRRIFEPVPSPDDIPAPIVSLRVTDERGEVGTYQIPISYGLGDVPPTADADPSDAPEIGYHILLGDSLFLNGSQSIEPNREDWVRVYRWWVNREPNDQWSDWQVESVDDNGDAQESIVEITPAVLASFGVDDIGEYPLAFLAEDRTFLTATDTSRLTVHAPHPVARISVPRSQVACGEQFTLDGSASAHDHPQIRIVSYEWDLDGDGEYGTAGDREGAQVLFTANQFSFDGPQVIKLRVTDSRGNTSEEQITVAVDQGNSAPVASVGGPYAIAASDAVVQLDAGGSVDGEERCGDSIVSYAWDLDGDGQYGSSALEQRIANQVTPELNQADLATIFNPNPIDTYEIGVRVTDRWGARQESRGELRVFNGPRAVAVAEPPRAACDTDVRFSGLASTTDGPLDKGFQIVSYEWDFDQDGETDSDEALTVYRVGLGGADVEATLTITDASGRTDTDTVTFEINLDNNVSPVANAGGPYATGPINAGQMTPIDLDARASYDPDEPCDQITIYKWDTDGDGLYGSDDTNGAGFRAGSDYTGSIIRGFTDPTWEVGLSKLVRVIVCDGRGSCSAPAVQEVDVRPNPPPTGEILSPRADDCLTSDNTFDLRLKYRDPDGGTARIKVFIDQIEVHRENVEAAPNGADSEVTLTVDISDLPDGLHSLSVEIGDFFGAATMLNPGGIMTFDRLAPTITFNRSLLEGACYAPGEAPDPSPEVNDDLDTTPTTEVRFFTDACQRTVNVTATDSCGNRTIAERSYRVSGPVALVLDGPEDGQLVGGADARFTWTVDGPDSCVNAVTAEINSEGGRTWVYQAGDLIEDPGAATLTIDARDCSNQSYLNQRSFRVNDAPISRPQPPGHPNSVPLSPIPTYIIGEGLPLLLEASSSAPPEDDDEVAQYRWDFDNDGVVDAQGISVNAETDEDGSFEGILEVEDSFGLTHRQTFEVIVNDVDPIAAVGGPYQGLQGVEVSFDARESRAANDADPLSDDPQRPALVWEWGDGQTTEGSYAAVAQAAHTYADDGLYQVRLRVRDEDSESTNTARVSVGDVNPVINDVVLPAAAYALEDLEFVVDATPGAPNDLIVSYEWDFLGTGEYEAFPTATASYRYLEAGDYQIGLRVVDPDSVTERTFNISVREVTLSDLLSEIDTAVTEQLADPDLGIAVRNALSPAGMPPASEWVSRGLWAEQRRDEALAGTLDADALELLADVVGAASLSDRMTELYRGNTLLALDELLFRLNRAQVAGARFGVLMWKISRQLLRETEASYQRSYARAETAFNEGASPFIVQEDARLLQSSALLQVSRVMFDDIDFLDRVTTRDGFLARDLHATLSEAHFLVRDVSDISHQANEFYLESEGDPVARVAEGNSVNQELIRALEQLNAELVAYAAAAADQGQGAGPGLASIEAALASLNQIQSWVVQPIGLTCQQPDPDHPDCQFIDDADSLSLQLALMDLVGDLFAAADAGAYVRNAQQLLTVAVKFRVEVALLRVEDLCGLNNPYPISARAQQRVLLNLLDEGQRDAALLYYIAPERRCLVYEQYNECVIPALNQQNAVDEPDREPVAYPEVCEGIELIAPGEGGGVVELVAPIPPREAFTDLNKLFDIILAINNDWNVADPQIRARHFPDREWSDFNRDMRDDAFTVSDMLFAMQQFNHDTVDYDEDGLMGIYEIDCRLRFDMPLNPNNARSMDGAEDHTHDCDGDGIPNGDEVALSLNPVEPDDSALDTDRDGVSNVLEWTWAQRGLEMDLRDPTDAGQDQDGDGVPNGLEILGKLDPLNPNDAGGDFDGDGIDNGAELLNGLNPRDPDDADADQDGDGLTAREEILRGRNPLVADCEADQAEVGARDDDPDRARELLASQEGLICSAVGAEDVDWYRFSVTRDNQRFVARLLADEPGMTISLFQASDGAQVDSSVGRYEDALIALPRGQLESGQDYLIKVSHRAGDRAPQVDYQLEYALINPDAPCVDDRWEGDQGNNQRGVATVLGAEEVRLGDAWVCQDERNVGDWYTINLEGSDKTVHIGFSPTSDGRLELAVMDQDLTRYAESVALQKSAQCINISANDQAGLLYLRVTAATLYSDGDERVDYTLQVVDTDLDANPRGECDTLNNGLFDFFDWPTLDY